MTGTFLVFPPDMTEEQRETAKANIAKADARKALLEIDYDHHRISQAVSAYLHRTKLTPPFDRNDLDSVAWVAIMFERERIDKLLRDAGFIKQAEFIREKT